jgi:hypothetical protein|tara:strand:+ start:327 stop:812 length:486 start_codon:yes stop_codon:yes gene_type:complete
MHIVKKNKLLIILTLLFLNLSFEVFSVEKLDGAWFECEFSGKTSQPTDNCQMLDNDGFIFSKNVAAHISVIDSQETNCKKNKIGQCFQSNLSFITVRRGRKDKVQFKNSKLILTFLGCGQVFNLTNKIDYIEAKPDEKKCFWAGKKIFYLKKYNGKLIYQK